MKHLVCAALLLLSGSLLSQEQEPSIEPVEATQPVVEHSYQDQDKLTQEVARLREELTRFNKNLFADADKDPKSERWMKAVRVMAVITLAYQTRNAVAYAYRLLTGRAYLLY